MFRRVKHETKRVKQKRLFVMSLLTSRGKQGLALNIASNSSSEKLHLVVSPELDMPFEAAYA